jgi:alpha-tubulin suppressor-like RCC1 family protein
MSNNKDGKSRVKKPPSANLRPHVYTWGWGADGRLGVGNEYDQLTPQQIKVNNDMTTKVVQVASGKRRPSLSFSLNTLSLPFPLTGGISQEGSLTNF